MEHTKSFVISEFTNPSGKIGFRLFGWLDGKRIRENFDPAGRDVGPDLIQHLGLKLQALEIL